MQHVGPSLNVVYLYNVFEDDTHIHLVLEYCRGGVRHPLLTSLDVHQFVKLLNHPSGHSGTRTRRWLVRRDSISVDPETIAPISPIPPDGPIGPNCPILIA
eukprot:4641706-Pyramimonas_sp.AAC.1